MRLIGLLLRGVLVLVVIVGAACIADAAWRVFRPENTRHARFGEPCRDIHADLAEKDGKAPPAHCIRVHFGTPREPVGAPGSRSFGFGREFDGRLHLGHADVSLPLLASEEKDGQAGVRKRGEVDLKPDGAPDDAEDTIKYASITEIAEDGDETSFVADLNRALDESDANALLVFVHGYNQSFDTAIIRAAQIAVDLTFDPADPANTGGDKPGFGEPSYAFGRPVLFSWPNGNFLCAYCSDQKKAELSAPYLSQFLALLMRDANVDEINLVVHSMGNRVLVKAIEDIAREHMRMKVIKKFRIVNAAADVGRSDYALAMAAAEAGTAEAGDDGRFAPNVTIYASQNDLAMAASFLANGFKTRLGQIIPAQAPFVSADDRYVTIDTAVVSADLFGHGYYSESGNVIADMSCFFADRPIESERAISPVGSGLTDGRRHYRFVAPDEAGLRVCAPNVAPFSLSSADAYFSSLGLSYDEYSRRRTRELAGPSAFPAPPPPPPPPPPAIPYGEFAVYFAFGGTELTEEAKAVLDEAAYAAGYAPSARIVATGHVDAAEAAENADGGEALALARAEKAKAYLVERGMAADRIETKSAGAREPAVLTGPGLREPQNRRVVIEING